MNIIIDEGSGCCNGVVRALHRAEEILDIEGSLYSLGDIVHNGTEIKRLAKKGLKIIDLTAFGNMKGTTVLIRAHGEPPSTYETALKNHINIIDCTCPVVLKLQQKIAQTYNNIKQEKGQIIIFGKKGHAEVLGLVGQTEGNAVVIEKLSDINSSIATGKINLNHPIEIFSQTTKDPKEYTEICELLKNEISSHKGAIKSFRITDSICRQVSSRNTQLVNFSKERDVIIFVCGKESSNGHLLYDLCKHNNERSYMIEDSNDLKREWFKANDKVGICGATSTPKWQLEEVSLKLSTYNF